MASRAGVGYSENSSSGQAGAEVARAALADGGLDHCDLVLVYATEKHDPAQLRDGIRSVVGPKARLIGGYSMGIITNDRLGYAGYQVELAAIASDTMRVDMFIETGLVDREREVGVVLGEQIKSQRYKGDPNLLLMYNSVKRSAAEGLALNLATPLIAGVTQALGTWPPAAGVGMMGSMQWNPTFQWFDDRIEQRSAMALVLSGGVRLDTIIMHGCRPAGGYHTITRAEGPAVIEIDGKPALEVISQLLGPNPTRTGRIFRSLSRSASTRATSSVRSAKRITPTASSWPSTRSAAR